VTNQTPLLVTVDVEGTVDTGSYDSVNLLDKLLSDLALPATLFVTPDVLQHRTETVEHWISKGHAVGLHIHPERLGGESDCLGTYDQDDIESFIREGIDVFESYLGVRPYLFRAGRWSFSEELLNALTATDIKYDASHRPVHQSGPYMQHDVVEFPLSVYGSWLFRNRFFPWDVETLPLSIDALFTSELRSIACYAATLRILAANPPYLMMGFHDYDLTTPSIRKRIERYIARISEFTDPAPLDEMSVHPIEQNH